jgi:ubiquinone/menaquinone biosynthesis C-methylase UbiE
MSQQNDSAIVAGAKATVSREAFLWGDSVTEVYHSKAASHMDRQWNEIIRPILLRHPIDYSMTMDLACGQGRNSTKLSPLSQRMILVDVNPENIATVKKRFAADKHEFLLNSGFDLAGVESGSISFLYTFDSMVHFDTEIVLLYVKECYRVLRSGAHGFVHHSNFTGAPGADFRNNPHWRNFMSKELFAHFCIRNGLEVVEQVLIPWGDMRDLDCLTVFRKPAG